MHCGTFISRAFSAAAFSSFHAPSAVNLTDAAVSGIYDLLLLPIIFLALESEPSPSGRCKRFRVTH
jgi:hypothetical protein